MNVVLPSWRPLPHTVNNGNQGRGCGRDHGNDGPSRRVGLAILPARRIDEAQAALVTSFRHTHEEESSWYTAPGVQGPPLPIGR